MSQPPLPRHGGNLHDAIQHHGIPRNDWLDLSTGISPFAWPVPTLPVDVWQRLPEDDGELEQAALHYYGATGLPVPGSQWAIQQLPTLFPATRVWIAEESYEEYRFHWQQRHRVENFSTLPVDDQIQSGDIVIVINPNNPTANYYSPAQLLALAEQLQQHNGWLIVDEAFMDATPEHSLLPQIAGHDNVILLRSLGKFFGLAGIRVGFVFARESVRAELAQRLGPWAISHPARHIAIQALRDTSWQRHNRERLKHAGAALHDLLAQHFPGHAIHSTPLFASLILTQHDAVLRWQSRLAKQGIWVRAFTPSNRLRLGVTNDAGLERLTQSLQDVCTNLTELRDL